MIYITGDTHRDFTRLIYLCQINKTTKRDILIILGDAGINYYGQRDNELKQDLNKLPITLFCIHGNHEKRPESIKTYKERTFKKGIVYYEEKFEPFQHKTVLFVNGGGPIKQNYKSYPCFTSWGELVAVNDVIGITFNWRSGKSEDISAMIDYLFVHAKELGIAVNEICVFPLCRAVNNTINCVLKYPEIRKLILYYGKISESTKLVKCENMKH